MKNESTEIYYLYTFYDSNKMVITRGRTMEEAYKYASKNWRRGETITIANFNPIWAAKRYSENHSPGWLERPPMWLSNEIGTK